MSAAGESAPGSARTSPGADRPAEPPTWLREVLRCPATGGVLEDRRDADGRLVGLLSREADPPLLYPVVDGVPVLLVDEAREVGQEVGQEAGDETDAPAGEEGPTSDRRPSAADEGTAGA